MAVMSDLWGKTPLRVVSMARPKTQVGLTEKPVIPAPGASGPQSILMGTGRLRRRREIRGLATPAEYDQLEADYEALVVRTVTLADGMVMRAMIASLEADEVEGTGGSLLSYTMTLVEA
ncbi:hypothetical protein STH324 [Symbiobacterium thermophilum IAM 14863]|uniref:Uncharacterized protein n=2 Tax=Symbiobacterium thermophilum TaxID=2734 RepID=Q67SN4_SYMTH|nr:hypothetical protein STH324 [Symbiobacterium thermophilum IAM 14863]